MPYKTTWCRKVTEVGDFVLPVTLKGLLLAYVWDKALRPFAKHVFSQLPQGFRQGILRRVVQ